MARDFDISRPLRLREAFPPYVGMLGTGVSAPERVCARAKWGRCQAQGRRTRQEAQFSVAYQSTTTNPEASSTPSPLRDRTP
ncbi:hypothetical protein PF003_g17098 [Phytophthora fragariae]|nr:hypothetical protein PF003_g17098 [Phytophthora fragariae]